MKTTTTMYNFWDNWLQSHDRYERMSEDEQIRNGCFQATAFVVAVILLFILCALSGCKGTEYVVIPDVRIDTLIITKHQRDSIYLRDSTHVSESQHGDTIILKVTKWRTEYRERAVHDTIYESHTDSVPYPVPVEVIEEVPRQLTWWQQLRLNLGSIFLGLIGLIGLIGIIKLKMKIWP